MLKSSLCTQTQLESEELLRWTDRLRPAWDAQGNGLRVNLHRKVWEWAFIAQALHERAALREGSRGLGFGVGREPQAALFASLGCSVVATDLAPAEQAARRWVDSAQHAASVKALNSAGLCPPDVMDARVRFLPVDMNEIPEDLRGFDFTWSACAFEHLGSIAAGLRFIREQMKCLKPGGVAVHTTELNLSPGWRTIDWTHTVLFRRRDIEALAQELIRDGHRVELDFSRGDRPADRHVDAPPYGPVHLRLWIEEFQATSFGLIIEKAQGPVRRPRPPNPVELLSRQVGSKLRYIDSLGRTLRQKGRSLARKLGGAERKEASGKSS